MEKRDNMLINQLKVTEQYPVDKQVLKLMLERLQYCTIIVVNTKTEKSHGFTRVRQVHIHLSTSAIVTVGI